MKVISYSLFGDPDSFEFPFYLRGIYFNARMNRLLYPDWQTHVAYSSKLHLGDFFGILNSRYDISISAPNIYNHYNNDKCRMMLWRLFPVFEVGVTHVLSRDTDAITTYRESKSVERWLKSGMGYHGINDDQAHSIPMMGGMIGIKTDHFKRDFPEFKSWNNLIGNSKLSTHGTDQDLLMKKIYPRIGGKNLYWDRNPLQQRDNPIWESDLTCRMIGSPGVVDFELLRFFKRFDPKGEAINDDLRKLSPDVRKHFYWL